MSENTRKLLSLLMAAAILFSMLPVGVVAHAEVPTVQTGTASAATATMGALVMGENSVAVTEAGTGVRYSFTPETTGIYNIYSTGEDDTKAVLHDAEGNHLEEDDDGGKDYNFMISCQLTAGQTYTLELSYWESGMTGTMTVLVEQSPLVSISFTPVTVIEHSCGGIQTDWDEETESYQEYFSYGAAALLNKSTFTATFKDGTVITESGSGFYYQDVWYEFDYSTNQGYTNQWTVGNTYEFDVEVVGCTAKVPVTIAPSPLVSLSFTPVSVIEGTCGYTTEHWEGDTCQGEFFVYYIGELLSRSTYTATFSDGTVLTATGTQLTYEDENYDFNVTADQSYENRWLAGNTYEMTVSVMGKSVKVPVTVEKQPLESITFTPVSVPAYTNGYTTNEWDEVTGSAQSYYIYNTWDLLFRSTFTATFTDGTVLQGKDSGLEYAGEWYGFGYSAEQTYATRWLPGNTYAIDVSVLGQDVQIPVTIEESPLESLSFTPVSVTERTYGQTHQYWLDDDTCEEYFVYYTDQLLYSSVYTATFDDGTVLTGSGRYFTYQGEDYFFECSADQSYENRWLPGNTYAINVSVLGQNVQIPVTIDPFPLESITFTPISVTEGTNGYSSTYWDEAAQAYREYYYYEPWDLIQQSVFTATFDDDAVLSDSNTGFYFKGMWFEFEIEAEQDQQNQWLPGNTYYLTVSIMGKTVEVPVTVVAEPLQSITFAPVSVMEGTSGHYVNFNSQWEYFEYDGFERAFTATFEDGTEVTGTGGSFSYGGREYYIHYSAEQDWDNQWTAGNTYYVTATVAGVTGQLPVTITESPLVSLTFEPISVMENTGGYEESGWDEETGDSWAYYYYSDYYLLDSTTFTATFADGTVYTGAGDQFEYDGEWYEFTVRTDQTRYDPWTAGNTYHIRVAVWGETVNVPVTVTASPLESLTFTPVSVTENTNGYLSSWWDEQTQSDVEYYHYFENLLLQQSTFTATFTDGTVLTGSESGFTYGGEWYEFIWNPDQSGEDPWVAGNTYELYVSVMDKTVAIPVTVVKSCVDGHTYTDDSDTYCNVCNEYAYPGGNTLVNENGKWYHVKDRQKVSDTTLVSFAGDWYYVKNGVVDFDATTLCYFGSAWYYVKDGKVNYSNTLCYWGSNWYHVNNGKVVYDTTLVYWGSAWYYVKDGVVNQSNTLCYWNGNWYHVNGGKVVYDTTLVYWGSAWYYVKDGVVNQSNTLCNWNGNWYHVNGGKVVSDTTLVNFAGDWYYVKNGVVDFNATTLCYFGNSWYYVKGGKVNYSNTLCYWGSNWYHVKNGVVVYDTTLVYWGSAWYYVKDGVVNQSNTLCNWNGNWYHVKGGTVAYDTTLVNFAGDWYYVKNGVVDFNATTLCYFGSAWYYVKGGKVNYGNTLCNWNGKWYHVKNGTVVYDTTLVYFGSSWYCVRNGVVDFNYSGKVLFAGTYYTVKNGVKV